VIVLFKSVSALSNLTRDLIIFLIKLTWPNPFEPESDLTRLIATSMYNQISAKESDMCPHCCCCCCCQLLINSPNTFHFFFFFFLLNENSPRLFTIQLRYVSSSPCSSNGPYFSLLWPQALAQDTGYSTQQASAVQTTNRWQ
jgi:hypothetical protein